MQWYCLQEHLQRHHWDDLHHGLEQLSSRFVFFVTFFQIWIHIRELLIPYSFVCQFRQRRGLSTNVVQMQRLKSWIICYRTCDDKQTGMFDDHVGCAQYGFYSDDSYGLIARWHRRIHVASDIDDHCFDFWWQLNFEAFIDVMLLSVTMCTTVQQETKEREKHRLNHSLGEATGIWWQPQISARFIDIMVLCCLVLNCSCYE